MALPLTTAIETRVCGVVAERGLSSGTPPFSSAPSRASWGPSPGLHVDSLVISLQVNPRAWLDA